MTRYMLKLALFSATALASVNGAAAQLPAFSGDELFLSETPLNADELSEARGGFSVGGLKFDISVDIAPISVNPIPEGGLFGEGGVFNGNSPIPEGGLFGDGGVFNGGSPIKTVSAEAPPTPAPAPIETQAPQAAPSAPAQTTAPAPAPAAAPAETPTVVFASSGGAPVSSQPAATTAAPAQPAAPTTQANAAPASSPQTQAAPVQQAAAPSTAASAAAPSSSIPNSALAQGQTQLVINNTLDNVVLSRLVEINVSVPNFDLQANLSNVNALATQALVARSILGALK